MNSRSNAPDSQRRFKLLFVPLVIFSLVAQLAVIWTQRELIGKGYFDFVLYYSAAQIIADGRGAQLYDLELQRRYQQTIRERMDRDLPFNHLPYELVPLVPLANLPFPLAHAVWSAANLLLIAILLKRLFCLIRMEHRSLAALMTIGFFPTLTALKMGQDSILTVYLLVETAVSLKRKRYALAGATLALGLYKPQFFLPLAGLLLWRRRWPALYGFAAMSLALGLISFALVGWSGFLGLFSLWLPMIERGHVVWPELMINLRGLIHVGLGLVSFADSGNILTLIVSTFVYGATLAICRGGIDHANETFNLRFSLAIVATALISFHLYSYDGMLLLIPLILMADRWLHEAAGSSLRQRAFFLVLLAWFIPLLPNVLLSAAILACWTLPLPLLFWILAVEVRSHRAPAKIVNTAADAGEFNAP